METTTTPASGSSTPASSGGSQRVEEFKSEVGDMRLKAGSAGREKAIGTLGLVLMIVGVIGGFVSYVAATNSPGSQSGSADIQELIVLAITFACVTVLGAALFLRYAFANFLRMWLLRNLYEGQANADRIIEAIVEKR